jgi:hypothetical protein
MQEELKQYALKIFMERGLCDSTRSRIWNDIRFGLITNKKQIDAIAGKTQHSQRKLKVVSDEQSSQAS